MDWLLYFRNKLQQCGTMAIHFGHLLGWFAAKLWDWGAVLFIVTALWTFGAIGIGAALAEPIPSAIEIAGAASLIGLGGLLLLFRILHSAWKTAELTSMFQRVMATIIALTLFMVFAHLGGRYLRDKVPLLDIDISKSILHPIGPPPDFPSVFNSPKEQEKPEVDLKLIYPESPSVLLVNTSNVPARDIKWGVVLWNHNKQEDNNPFQIPVQTFDWIKGKRLGGPEDLFSKVAGQLNKGDILYGSMFADCPLCGKGKSYVVFINYKNGGWFSEIKGQYSGGPVMPAKFSAETREAYYQSILHIPQAERMPIAEQITPQ